ncbi:MAG: DUF4184 family protein [Chitinophagales bacterium]
MPFTYSHIGFVLPIHKKWKAKLSISGLIFGSIAPDYDILFRLTNVRQHIFQYDLFSIFFVIFPLATVSAICFHIFCRVILIEQLPEAYTKRYARYKNVDFFVYLKTHYLAFSASCILAIFVHLFLDFFCHILDAYNVRLFISTFTNNSVLLNLSYLLAIYLLPILFSLYGFYLLYKYEGIRPQFFKSLRLSANAVKFWTFWLIVTLIIAALKYQLSEMDVAFYFDFCIITLTSAALIALYVVCMLKYILQKWKTNQ